jgi:hypothetical protein
MVPRLYGTTALAEIADHFKAKDNVVKLNGHCNVGNVE